MKRIACSRMWSDVNIRAPMHQISNCCKRIAHDTSEEEIELLGKDVFSQRPGLVQDRSNVLATDRLDANCAECIETWPNAAWNSYNQWKDRDWTSDEIAILPQEDCVDRVELMLSNTCNMTCMYCSKYFSSSWAKLEGSEVIQASDSWQNTMLDALYSFVKTRKNDRIVFAFLGGEPLLEPKVFDVLDMLIDAIQESDTSGHRIQITSNLNLKSKVIENFLKRVEQSPEVSWEVNASIDAVGYPGTQIRDGLDWKLFEQNACRILKCENIKRIDFLSTISCLNIPYYRELLEWIFSISIEHRGFDSFGKRWRAECSHVADPQQMFPGVLPVRYQQTMQECISLVQDSGIPRAEEFIDELKNVQGMIGTRRSLVDVESAKIWFERQGNLRGKNYLQIFPHLNEIITPGE